MDEAAEVRQRSQFVPRQAARFAQIVGPDDVRRDDFLVEEGVEDFRRHVLPLVQRCSSNRVLVLFE